MIAVGCCLVFSGSDNLYPIVPHQAPHAAVPYVQPQFLQFLGHPGPAVALQAKAVLFSDMSQNHHIITLTPLMLVNKHCRAVAGS